MDERIRMVWKSKILQESHFNHLVNCDRCIRYDISDYVGIGDVNCDICGNRHMVEEDTWLVGCEKLRKTRLIICPICVNLIEVARIKRDMKIATDTFVERIQNLRRIEDNI